MRRKVITQGNGTLTITLPKKWTESVGIKGGDEVEVEETEIGIRISSYKTTKLRKISIDSTKFNDRVTRLALSAANKAGFDEIEVFYDNPATIKVLYELVKDLYMGFSIVEQTDKRCVLKAIAHDKVEDFDTVLRRAFLVALSMADLSLEMVQNKKFSDLQSLVPLEHFNNQLTNFCERMLNKKLYKNGNCFYYVVAWNLEKVCDNYKYLCDHCFENKLSINKRILAFYKEVNEFFRNYYQLFYKFDIDELVKLTAKGKELLKGARELHKDAKTASEFAMLTSLMDVVLQCLDFSASYIAIHKFN